MNGQNRSDVKIGETVKIVLKADQRTGKLTEGTVGKILTNSSYHPHGIKVFLASRFSSTPEVYFPSTPFPLLGFHG